MDETARMDFIRAAIHEHRGSDAYRIAFNAELYYNGENPTINNYEKVLYDMQGKAHRDMWTANHKIASSFFRIVVDQEVGYLLGNGVSFADEATKKKLGRGFDQRVMDAGEYALIAGVSFGFWNLDHLEVFKLTEFIPLYDEESAALKAGIRFWQVSADKPLRATLYELDGYTEYLQSKNKNMEVMRPKRTYKRVVRESKVDGTEILDGTNYPGFPIVPLKNNKNCKSELNGKRNTIDALDLASSNMVNNTDEGNIIYWVLKGAGGMDDIDDAEFINRLKTLHTVHIDAGLEADPHTLEAPFQGAAATIEMLEKKLAKDFQYFDPNIVIAGNQVATAIRASYAPLDQKTDKFERQVTDFITGILELAGIDDAPSYTRNQIINKTEEIQAVLLGAEYFDDEYITKKLLTILGDVDQFEEMMNRKDADDLERLGGGAENGELESGEEIATATEAVDAAEETVGKTLNGSQTSSLITVIRQLQGGGITEGQAVNIITTAIGVTKEEALRILRGE